MRRLPIFAGWLLGCWLAVVPAVQAAPSPEEIKDVARDMVCLCGTCNRESLSTCLCGYATGERETIGEMLDAGMTHDQIVADFVERFGSQVLSEPPEGYDVVWVVPFVVLAVGIVGVRQVLVLWRRNRESQAAPPGDADAPPAGRGSSSGSPSTSEVDRLRRDLEGYEE